MKRCFEFRTGSSAKFWNIELSESTETVHFGRIGTIGQRKYKSFGDEDDAAASFEKRIAEKLKKGYVEVSSSRTKSRVQIDAYGSWTSQKSWQKLYGEIAVMPAAFPVSTESIDDFESEWEFRFPKTFLKYMERFGAGEFNNFSKIHVPDGPEHYDLVACNTEVKRDYDFLQEQYARLEPVSRMIFFCTDFGANYFGWDPEDVRDAKNREYGVYEWSHGFDYVKEVATSFPDFLIEVLLNDRQQYLTDRDDEEEDEGATFVTAGEPPRKKPRRKKKKKAASTAKPSPRSAKESKKKQAPKRKPVAEERQWLLRVLKEVDSESLWKRYAEWLDGYNDPDADLIRVRRQLLAEKPGSSKYKDLRAREKELFSSQDSEWRKQRQSPYPLVTVLDKLGSKPDLDRDEEPIAIILEGEQVSVHAIRKLASFERTSLIYLREHALKPAELKAIGEFKNLEELQLRYTQLTDRGLQTLGGLKNLRSIAELDLRRQRMAGDGFAYLRDFKNLERLHLDSVNDDGKSARPISVKGLAALGKLKNLKTLSFRSCDLPPGSLRFLASLKSLERLDLQWNERLGDEDLKSLQGLQNLRSLELGSGITGKGLAYISKLTSLENLECGSGIGDEGAAYLKDLTKLRTLKLSAVGRDDPITNKGAAHLKKIVRLEVLDLAGNDISGDGLQFVARMKKLCEFSLDRNSGVNDESLKYLKSLRNIERLNLSGTTITDRGTTYLEDFPKMDSLELYNSHVSNRRHRQLKKVYPKATIEWSEPWG